MTKSNKKTKVEYRNFESENLSRIVYVYLQIDTMYQLLQRI